MQFLGSSPLEIILVSLTAQCSHMQQLMLSLLSGLLQLTPGPKIFARKSHLSVVSCAS